MRRYFDIAVTTLAAIIAAPIALWFIAFVSVAGFTLGLAILMLLLVLVHYIAGSVGVFLAVLGIIAGVVYGIRAVIIEMRRSRLLTRTLPHLNAYKDLIARYDPDTLSNPHADNVRYYQRKYAEHLVATTRRDLVPQTDDPRRS